MSLFRENLFKNTYVKVFRNIALIGQGIILAPLIIDTLGLKFAAFWFLITQFTAYIQLAELGIPTGLIRISSKYLALDDKKKSGEVTVICFFLLFTIALSITLFSENFVELFFSIFKLTGAPDGAQYALKLALIITAVNLPLRCGISILEANHKFYVHLRVETILIILRVCVLYLIAYLNLLDLLILVLIYYGTSFLIHATQFILALKINEIGNINNTLKNTPKYFKQIFTMGVSVMIVTASATTLRQGTPLLIGLVNGIDEGVALFSITMLLVVSTMQFLTVPVSFVGPQASQLHEKNEVKILYKTFLKFSKYSLILATFTSIIFAAFGKVFLNMWLDMGETDIHTIYHLTLVIIIPFSLSIPSLYARKILSFAGRHIIISILELSIVLTGLVIGYLNIVKFDLGLLGVASGVGIIFILRSFGPLMWLTVRYFKIDIKKYLTDVYLKYTLLMIALVLAYMTLCSFGASENIVHALTLALFITLAWAYMLEDVHKEKIKQLLGNYFYQQ